MSDTITPTVQAASEPTVQDPTNGTPVADPANGGATPTAEEPHVEKDRLKGALEKVEHVNEEMRKVVDLQASLVQDDPALIHKIYKETPEIADRIIEKIWADDGIKSYKQLRERIELEKVKETNPEAYKAQVDVSEIKRKLEEREKKDRANALSNFCASKGFQANQYDPNFKKLQDALNYINPALLEEDYSKALELAFNMNSSRMAATGEPMPQTMSYSGSNSASLPSSKPAVSERSQWLASEFNKRFKYNIDLNKAR